MHHKKGTAKRVNYIKRRNEQTQGLLVAGGGERKGIVGIVGIEGMLGRGGKVTFGSVGKVGMVGMLGSGGSVGLGRDG